MTLASCIRVMVLGVLTFATIFTPASALRAQDDLPEEALNLANEAKDLQNAGEFDLAAEVWSSYLEKFPETSLADRAQHYLGVCQLQLGQISEAKDSFAKVVASSNEDAPFPFLEDAMLNLGWCYFNLGQRGIDADINFPLATETLRRLLSEFENGKYGDQANYFTGEALYLSGDVEGCIEYYQAVADDYEESGLRSNALYALGVALEDLDRTEEAIAAYETFASDYQGHGLSLEIDMRMAELILQRGLSQEQDGSLEESRSSFSTALATFEVLAANDAYDQQDLALLKQAYCTFKLGDIAKSAELYAALAENHPTSSYARSAALSAGRFYYRTDALDDALTWLETVANGDDNEAVEAAHWICRIHLKQSKPDLAYLVANGMLGKNPAESEFLVLLMLDRADAAYELPERRDSAIDLYTQVASTYPDDPQAGQGWYYASFAAFENREYTRALSFADEFLDRFADEALALDVLSIQGESHLQLAQYAESEAAFRDLTERNSDRPEATTWLLRLALSLYLQEEYADAVALLERQTDAMPTADARAEALHLIGASQFRQQQYTQAVTNLSGSLAANADWQQADETKLLLARAQFREGDTGQAITSIRSLIDDHADSARWIEAHYRLGEFYFSQDEFDSAITAYDVVLQGDESDSFRPFALDGRAWSLFKQRQYEDAADAFGELISNHATHELTQQARYGQAVCLNQMNDHEEALSNISTYLQQDLSQNDRANGLFEQGRAQVGLEQFAEAANTFESIVENHSEFDRMEQALYELGWCYLDLDQEARAVAPFTRLTEEFASGGFAAEAHFHIGEALYADKEYTAAIAQYTQAVAKAGDSNIGENARYKLGWAHFHLEDFDDALAMFTEQIATHEDGALAIDGEFMVAECHYRLNDFESALPQYRKVWPMIKDNTSVDSSYKASTLLHGAQSAGQVQDWATAEEYATLFVNDFSRSKEVPEAWLQIGRAQRGLDQLTEAIESLEKAALQSSNEVGAQARFLIGEIHFGNKNFEEAQRQYRRVMLGYGGDDATDEVKLYQAMAAFEAGRCSDVQIRDATGDARTQHIEDAMRFYQDVVTKYANSPYAPAAQRRLEALADLD